MTDALRAALVQSHEHHDEIYEEEWQRLEESDGWRRIEPKIRHVTLGSATLRTKEEVRVWIEKTELELLEQVRQGPISIG